MADDTYDLICSLENLEIAHKRARKGKTRKQYVIDFEEKLDENLKQLRNELIMQTYQPLPLKTFILRDPKTRKISKSAYRDRVIHHALINIIEPTFDKSFIHDSYANRMGKGTLAAIKRYDQYKRKTTCNLSKHAFVLKADIRHYFETVDHNKLISILQEKIRDEKVIRLIQTILTNHKTENPGKGMPLGNLTSQFFANVYLDKLDQFVKHNLKAKHYIRYVDDFIILHHTKELLLRYQAEINRYLQEALLLELHPDKTKIIPIERGVGFLGLRIFPHHKLLKQKNVRKFQNTLNALKQDYHNGLIEREDVLEVLQGWLAYASNANTHRLQCRILKEFETMFPMQRPEKPAQTNEIIKQKLNLNTMEFSTQKTLKLLKQGHGIKDIAEKRGIKESTVYEHIASLIEHNQFSLYKILPLQKINLIISHVHSLQGKLKDIKERLSDPSISYDEISLVLAHKKAISKPRNISTLVIWHKKRICINCQTQKRAQCAEKLNRIALTSPQLQMTKGDFVKFIHNHTTFCNRS